MEFDDVLTAIVLIVIAFPLYWLLITSVKLDIDVAHFPPVFFPKRFTLDNYTSVFQTENAYKFWINSIVTALTTTFLTCLLGSMAAYALAKTYLASTIRQKSPARLALGGCSGGRRRIRDRRIRNTT